MLRQLKRFVLMIQFMTTIPIRADINAKSEDYGKGLIYAPIVGLVIGAVIAMPIFILWNMGLMNSPGIFSALVLILYGILTGGLHLDGLADTFDGMFSGESIERKLEIMRDSRVGANAILALISVYLFNYSLLYQILRRFSVLTAGCGALSAGCGALSAGCGVLLTGCVSQANGYGILTAISLIILFPVTGRVSLLIASGCSRYARDGEGLGKSFVDNCTYKEILIGLVGYFLCFFILLGLRGLLISIAPILTAFLLTALFSGKLNGVTGDVLGAICELNQTLFLFVTVLLYPRI